MLPSTTSTTTTPTLRTLMSADGWRLPRLSKSSHCYQLRHCIGRQVAEAYLSCGNVVGPKHLKHMLTVSPAKLLSAGTISAPLSLQVSVSSLMPTISSLSVSSQAHGACVRPAD